jgi:hypothetical protein
VAVKLGNEALGGNDPAASGELLRVVRLPDLDLIDVTLREAGCTQCILETDSIVVARVSVAHEKILFTAEEDLKPCHEVVWELATSKVSLELSENGSYRRGLDVLGSVHAEAAEADTQEVSEVSSNTFTDVLRLSIEVS